MKKFLIMALAAIALASCSGNKKTEVTNVRWCTFNIRCIAGIDNEQGVGWDSRKDRVCQWVKDKNIDVVGMQEVTHQQLMDVLERLPEFDYV